LIALLYLLIYLLNGSLVFTKDCDSSKPNYFNKVGENKDKMSVDEFCLDKAKCLRRFAEKVYGIGFDEDPDYDYLKFILTKPLLET
jgi:casein kinase 1